MRSWLVMLMACTGAEETDTPSAPEAEAGPIGAIQGRDPLTCATDGTVVGWQVDGEPFVPTVLESISAEETRRGRSWSCVVERDGVQTVSPPVDVEPLGGNILVFLLDDIGVEKIGAYGLLDDVAPQTPVLDTLADTGIRFDRAWATPVCSSTRAGMLTGRHGRRTGVGWIIGVQGGTEHMAAYDEIFVPEMLRYSALDYSSAMAGKWHLALHDQVYFDHPSAGAGFDFHSGSHDNLQRGFVLPQETRSYYIWEENFDGELQVMDVYATRRTMNQAGALTEAMPEPWFLYVPLNGAHTPYHVPPDDLVYTPPANATPPERFRAMVESVDIAIGNVLMSMDPDVRSRTTVFVIGDNGTAIASMEPRREFGKGSLTEAGVRVPFIVSGYGVETSGVSHRLVHTVDVFDTIAAMAGADLESMDAMGAPVRDSRSFLPALGDLAAPGPTVQYTEGFYPNGAGPYELSMRGVSDGRFKIVTTTGEADLMFDLQDQPFEDLSEDLYASGPLSAEAAAAEVVLRDALDEYRGSLSYDSSPE